MEEPGAEFPINPWPVSRWSPLSTRGEDNYGEWPEQPAAEPAPVTAASATQYPFDVTVNSTDHTVTIRPGTINQILPSNILSTFSVSGSSIYYVKVRGLTNGFRVTSATMVVDTTPAADQTPTAGALPTTIEVVVGVVYSDSAIRTIGPGSVTLGSLTRYSVDKVAPIQPGETSKTDYFAWTVNT